MKSLLLLIKLGLFILLVSCATTAQTSSDSTVKAEETEAAEIPPIYQLKTDKGYVFGNNVGDKYFIFFLPGQELKLDVIQGNLLMILDNQIYQLMTKDISPNALKDHSREDILMAFRKYESDYIQEQVKSSINFYDDYLIANEETDKTFHIWGYDQPEELQSSDTSTQVQLFMAVVENHPYIISINCPVADKGNVKNIEENMIRILSNVEFHDDPIDEVKMKEFYNTYYERY